MSFAIGSIPIIPPRSTGWWHGYWPGPAWRMRRRFAGSCAAPMPRPGYDDNRDGRLPVPVFMMREPLYTDGRRPPPSGPFLCGGDAASQDLLQSGARYREVRESGHGLSFQQEGEALCAVRFLELCGFTVFQQGLSRRIRWGSDRLFFLVFFITPYRPQTEPPAGY